MSTLIFAQPSSSSPQLDEFAPLNNLPSYPGGQQALEKYLNSLDLYPLPAVNAQLEGTVLVQFRVLPNGRLSDVRILRSCGALFDRAAIRAIALMPRWYPAHREGVTISYSVKLPITFELN